MKKRKMSLADIHEKVGESGISTMEDLLSEAKDLEVDLSPETLEKLRKIKEEEDRRV